MTMNLTTSPRTEGPLDLVVQPMGEHVVLSVSGELDAYSAETLRRQLVELDQAGHHTLVVDLASLEFIDSSGLGVLVGAYKRTRPHSGAVCLLSPSDRIAKMLRITGLDRVFPVHTDLQAALDHLNGLGG
jgi:anti-sigma B factor antagonist